MKFKQFEQKNPLFVFNFEILNDKIFLSSVTIVITSPDSTKPVYRAVKNSSADPIIAAFGIKAIRKDTSSVIDITDYFSGDQQVFSLDPTRKMYLKLAGIQTDRSFIEHIHTYPINTEIRTIKTFAVTPPSPPSPTPQPQVGQYFPAGLDAGFVTMEFNTSILLLPKEPMRKRFFDPRVGYFSISRGLYEEESQQSEDEVIIVRWRMEPRNEEDAAKQKKGELIRFVSAHEVGHTLGLRHNMGASSKTPVEKLRDKEWLARYGNTPSIMDYARFNYVAKPGDGITNFIPGIGDYDTWAIKWGYSYFGSSGNAEEEGQILNRWTIEALKDPRLQFGTEISPFDPRYQMEDLGDNAMKASEYGIKNLKLILPNLPAWSREEGKSFKELAELYDVLMGQFRLYLGHVSKNIGGVYDTPKTYDMEGAVFEAVPREIQKNAVDFLNRQIFATPEWILNQDVLSKIRPDKGIEQVKALQESTLNNLLEGSRIARLLETGGRSNTGYSLDELITDLHNGIMSEVKNRKASDIFRRNLQKVFVEKLISLLNPANTNISYIPQGAAYRMQSISVDLKKTDLPSIARGHLESMKTEIKRAIPEINDKLNKYHLQDMLDRIDAAFNPWNKKS